MCCFAQPVLSVTDTNLFARLTGTGSQFLAYQMNFSSVKPNAMILPLPVARPAAGQLLPFVQAPAFYLYGALCIVPKEMDTHTQGDHCFKNRTHLYEYHSVESRRSWFR